MQCAGAPNFKRASANGRVATIGVGAGEGGGSCTNLGQAAGSADHATQGHDVRLSSSMVTLIIQGDRGIFYQVGTSRAILEGLGAQGARPHEQCRPWS